MDRNAGLSPWQSGVAPQFCPGSFLEPPQPPRCCVVLSMPHTWESNVKLITLAAIAALTATPVLAQSIQDEQSRADYHQAKADAARAQMQKEDAQTQAGESAADAASAQAQANAAQSDASTLQARANAAQTQADVAQNQANTSKAQADSALSEADQARADRNAALDRAAEARNTIENQ